VMMSLFSVWALGLDDDDWDSVKKDMRGRLFNQYPTFSMLMPFRDEEGRLVQWDLSYMNPYGGLLGQRTGRRGDEMPWHQAMLKWTLEGNPISNMTIGLAYNKDPYFNRVLWQDGMGPIEGMGQQAKFVAGQIVPPLTPMVGTSWNGIFNSNVSTTALQNRSTWQQVTRSLGGVDLRYAGPQVWRMIDDFIADADYKPEMGWDGNTTSANRARTDLYQGVLQNDQEQFERAVRVLNEIEKDVKTPKDIRKLVNDRHPFRRLRRPDFGVFLDSLSGEDRRVAENVLEEYDRVRARAMNMFDKMD